MFQTTNQASFLDDLWVTYEWFIDGVWIGDVWADGCLALNGVEWHLTGVFVNLVDICLHLFYWVSDGF